MTAEKWPHYFLVNHHIRDSIANRLSDSKLEELLNDGYEIVDIDSFYKIREKFYKLNQAKVRKSEKQRLRRMLHGRE